ncbi:hypothetical protein MUCCIDRAFT_77036 [Mucor lusitanicus CBS 277.49]|uniref:Uncharacterized protein n=1 Tax=Mucor lusitanicus CBS 277.49 TaxID=747725 RepID=A0A162RQT4_MUCCL|nr:hypothetical protein MUCCIDRAFT_77036 [Mucor lusitanicus CBS 277.49]
MGNTKGSKRYDDAEKRILLDVIAEVKPTGPDQWTTVETLYMKAQRKAVNEANEEHREKTGEETLLALNWSLVPRSLTTLSRAVCFGTFEDSEEDSYEQDLEEESDLTIADMVEEAAASTDRAAPSPRSASRTTPMPRKTKGAQQHVQEFTEKLSNLADVIASSIEAKNRRLPPPSSSNNNNDERLKKLEENLTTVSGQVRDIHSMLQSLLAAKVSSGGDQQENESNNRQRVE